MASAYPSEELLPQAAAVAYRWRAGQLEFCLITSTQKSHWAFPKGMIDAGETWQQTALKEALEEAGLRGTIDPRPLGRYSYAKWGRQFEVTVGTLHVEDVLESWLESAVRSRRWASEEESLALIDRVELRQFLTLAAARLRDERS